MADDTKLIDREKYEQSLIHRLLSKGEKSGVTVRKNDNSLDELFIAPDLGKDELDYLLENPHIIPDECKKRTTLFWSQVLQSEHSSCVYGLRWKDAHWESGLVELILVGVI